MLFKIGAAVLLFAGACSALLAPRAAQRVLVRRDFLSPALSGLIEKTARENYEQIVTETMRREECSREEAEEKYHDYLFDPNGYALIKMKQQLMDEGYTSYEEAFVAKNGQEAWDTRQANLAAEKDGRQKNSVVIVAALFAVYLVVRQYVA